MLNIVQSIGIAAWVSSKVQINNGKEEVVSYKVFYQHIAKRTKIIYYKFLKK